MPTGTSDRKRAVWVMTIVLLLAVAGAGCEEDPGCLDALANNYQVDAADPCTDCCLFPEMRLSFRHQWVEDDTLRNFSADSSVYNIDGIAYRFDRVRVYLSDIRLIRTDGEEMRFNEELELLLPSGSDTVLQEVEDNVLLLEAGSFLRLTPGTYRIGGRFAALRFTVGVAAPLRLARPEQFPGNHPLSAQSPSMYEPDTGYVHSLITYAPLRGDSMTRTEVTWGAERLREVEIPVSFFLDNGFHTELTLAIDYRTWFEGVDLSRPLETVDVEQIVSNQAKSFTLTGIKSTLN